jgi:hypothetical protein
MFASGVISNVVDIRMKARAALKGQLLLVLNHCAERHDRFIPAWAGNTLLVVVHRRRRSVRPRVGGEHLRMPIMRGIKPVSQAAWQSCSNRVNHSRLLGTAGN